jgi:hypothetical protein
VAEDLRLASLLTCLHPSEGAVRLRVHLASDSRADLEGLSDPFRSVSDSISYSRLTAAAFQTDAGQVLQELFILRQSDVYPQSADDLWPLKNPDIDERWQRAWQAHGAGREEAAPPGEPLVIKGQIGPDGLLKPFHPLFFCKQTERFFRPPCPSCGRALELCRDEPLLAESGLGGYAGSLQRYLYCGECHANPTEPAFFVPRRQAAQSQRVADLPALIQSYASLVAVASGGRTELPCIGCPDLSACFGKADLAARRLAAFAFFPFYAFLYEAGSLHAADFLSLLGGASMEALVRRAAQAQRPGRLHALQRAPQLREPGWRRLFPAAEPIEQRFLETLYLKLSFLAQLADILMGPRLPWDDFGGFSLDRVWVGLPRSSGYLPSGWSFVVRHYGTGLDTDETPGLADQLPASRLYFFGQVWFWALLVNSAQDMPAVRSALDKLIRGWSSGVAEFRSARFQEIDPVFHPENVFFTPRGIEIPEASATRWQAALELGTSLLVACLDPQMPWAQDEFRKNLERLRLDIQRQLFQLPPPEPDRAPEPKPADRQIAAILARLGRKWRRETEAAQASGGNDRFAPMAAKPGSPDDGTAPAADSPDLVATLVLDPAARKAPAGAIPEEVLAETVRIAPGAAGALKGVPPDLEDLPETQILASRRGTRQGPAEKAGGASGRPQTGPGTPPEDPLEDLSETVVIRPKKEEA